jgi:two-component system response regulator FixJ
VYIVDDERDVAETIGMTLQGAGHQVASFTSGDAFLSVCEDLTPGCVLLDLLLPQKDGLQVQEELEQKVSCHAVAVVTGYGDVPDAVRAMRAGAIDFLRKPFSRSELFDVLDRAQAYIDECLRRREAAQRFAPLQGLSSRENQVLRALGRGLSTKQVASELAVSVRTIDMHRANIMKKLKIGNMTAALLLARDAEALAGLSPRR